MKRIIGTGSRDYPYPEIVRETMEYIKTWHGEFLLVHGGCKTGADRQMDDWARDQGWEPEVHEANWGQLKKAAGPLRNSEMVNRGANYCVGFPHPDKPSYGTRDCMTKAKKRGIQTWVIGPDGKAVLF